MKRKKILGLLLCLFCALFALTLSACGDNTQNNPEQNGGTQTPAASEGLQYTLLGDKTYYAVTGRGMCTDTDIIIPSTYEGLPVKSIADYSFKDFTLLTSIVIPNSVTSVGYAAFSGCSGLTSITLPFVGAQAEVIGDDTQYPLGYIFGTESFRGGESTDQDVYFSGFTTTGRTVVTYYLPASLKQIRVTGRIISYGAFSSCKRLTSVTIEKSVKSIGDYAFYNCSQLNSVFYTGSKTEWNDIAVGFYNYDLSNWYYYSETEPALNEEGTGYNGKYWHYAADGVTPVVWKKENRTTENTLARV